MNIVNIYGQQEKGDAERGKKENIIESWKRLVDDLKAIESRVKNVLILGD